MGDETLSVANYEQFKATLNTDAKVIDVSKLPYAQACRASIEAGWKGKRVNVEPHGEAEGGGDECRLVCKSCGASGIVRPKAKPFGCGSKAFYAGSVVIGIFFWPYLLFVFFLFALEVCAKHRQATAVCPKCGGHDLIPEDSPIGAKLMAENGVASASAVKQSGEDAQAKAEVGEVHEVWLTQCGSDKVAIVKLLRERGVGFADAMKMVAELPKLVSKFATQTEAESLRREIEATGSKAEIR